MTPAERIVQQQLDAYNARDLEAWLAAYSPFARLAALHGPMLAAGHAEMRQMMTPRFAEPDLRAELLARTVMGEVVVDHERITRNFPDGIGHVEMLCIYEVRNGRIEAATFATGVPRRAADDSREVPAGV